MIEPRRLRDLDADEFERDLLASSDVDVPSTRAYQRTVASLGVGLALPLSATAAAQGAGVAAALPGGKLGAVALGKWLAMGALAGVVTASGARLTSQAFSPAPQLSAHAAAVPVRTDPAPGSPVSVPEVPVLLAAEERAPQPQAERGRSEQVSPSATSPPAALPSSVPDLLLLSPSLPVARSTSLQGEMKRLEDARRALGRGDARSAIVTLEGYDTEFPQGTLLPEARLLEVSALLRVGERARARELGRRIILRDPRGPHAQAVRSLLSESEKP